MVVGTQVIVVSDIVDSPLLRHRNRRNKVVVIVIVVYIAHFNTGLCCLRLLGECFLDRF